MQSCTSLFIHTRCRGAPQTGPHCRNVVPVKMVTILQASCLCPPNLNLEKQKVREEPCKSIWVDLQHSKHKINPYNYCHPLPCLFLPGW